MQLQQNVSREVVAGVLIGGLCLAGILSILNATEDHAISLSYMGTVSTEK